MSKVEPIHATQALQPVLGAHDTWSPHSCSSLTFRHFLICGRTRTTTNGRPTHVIVVPLYLSLCFSEHIIFTILLIFSYQ
ncbi:hypothetical protein SORBI_3009G085700 [Sorghum bicolor]|uniref:Uncharacterized protein n=1 Tax=Sorghum bicolor TaxID=4558 RepID=A0A1B6P7E0_SORBI|nr:hypothetical protein SORBI_3009G085700 [Sorghum bicolor]